MIFNTNPYNGETPVGGTKAFVGRVDLLQDMLHILGNPHKNAVVLYGQNRIGKTSVLKELVVRLPHKGPFAPVYLDLSSATVPLKEALWDVSKQILHGFDIPPVASLKSDFSAAFQDTFLPHVLSQFPEGTALVLLFDEFDLPDDQGANQTEVHLLPYLRDLISSDTPRIKFVFVTRHRPDPLSKRQFPLFDGLRFYPVSYFSPGETAEVVHLSKQNASLKWTDDALAQIQRLTAGHPHLTQLLCHKIWESLYDDDPEDIPLVRFRDMEIAVTKVLHIAADPLRQLWDGLELTERVVASVLAEAGPQHLVRDELEARLRGSIARIFVRKLDETTESLEKWDIIQHEENGYRIRGEMLRRWIVQCGPLAEDEIRQSMASAEPIFKSAYTLHEEGKFDESVSLLQQVCTLNPDHLQAALLLAEIFMERGETGESLKLLEPLYDAAPLAIRPRLIQTLLMEARMTPDERCQRTVYKRILELSPDHAGAMVECEKIYERLGDTAYEKNEFDEAFAAYEKAGVAEKIKKVEQKMLLEDLCQHALDCLKMDQREKAMELLEQVLSADPSFQMAALYMELVRSDPDNADPESLIPESEASRTRPLPSLNSRVAPKGLWENVKAIGHKFSAFRQKFIGGFGQVGPYKLICPVAKGGMSELFLAINEKGDFRRAVIIKRVLPHLAENPQFISMFNQEAKLAACLYHPNIVQIIDFYEKQNAIVMEYVRGKNLSEIVKTPNDTFPFEQAVFVASQIAKGLEYAHSQKSEGAPLNIVHRDIKPSNILISFNGEVKITDFGISKANTGPEADAAGEVRGTLAYMAPEQVEKGSDAADHRTDIYSFGIVFYEMLTGTKLRMLVKGTSLEKAFNLIMENDLEPIINLRPEIPTELNRIVMKCLEKEKETRYQRAREVNEDLKRLKKDLNIIYDESNLADFMKTHFKEEESFNLGFET